VYEGFFIMFRKVAFNEWTVLNLRRIYMKKLIFVTLIFLLLSCGCISTHQTPPGVSPTSQTVLQTPPGTSVPVTTSTVIPNGTGGTVLTNENIKKHFLNIAFGRDNTYIEKSYPDPDYHLSFYLSGKFDDVDTALIMNFTKEYNKITTTSTFSDEVIKSQQSAYPGEIDLIFFPAESLKSMDESSIRHKEINTQTGDILFYIPRGNDKLYINTDLTGDDRKHAIIKAILYYLGYPGQTYDYPDSIFYANGFSNSVLTPLDIAAINTMYDARIYPGMSFDEARRTLLLNQ
jgi:hypothetical protein